MKTIVVVTSPRRRTTSSCMSRRITGSSAENGSSNSSTSGPVASALARPTRCCIPPESWSGRAAPSPFRPTSSRKSSARALPHVLVDALHLEPEGHVVDEIAVGEQAEVLEDHAHAVAAQVEQLPLVGGGDVELADPHRAGGRLDEAGQAADERRLAAAGQTHDDEHLAGVDVEVDVTDRDDIAGLGLQLASGEVGQRRTDDPLRARPEDLPQPPHRDRAPHGRSLREWAHVQP